MGRTKDPSGKCRQPARRTHKLGQVRVHLPLARESIRHFQRGLTLPEEWAQDPPSCCLPWIQSAETAPAAMWPAAACLQKLQETHSASRPGCAEQSSLEPAT